MLTHKLDYSPSASSYVDDSSARAQFIYEGVVDLGEYRSWLSHQEPIYEEDPFIDVLVRLRQQQAVYSHEGTAPSVSVDSHYAATVVRGASSAREYAHRAAIANRISKLRQLASASGDPFNKDSAELAQRVCEELATEIKPGVFLLADGNLRAFWRNDARESLGVQFLPDGYLQYVILRLGRIKMLQTLGVEEDVGGLISKVSCSGMERLWFHG